MAILNEAFTGTGNSKVFEVTRERSIVTIGIIDGTSGAATYTLDMYLGDLGTPAWKSLADVTFAVGETKRVELEPGYYRLNPDNETGTADLAVWGNNISIYATDPTA